MCECVCVCVCVCVCTAVREPLDNLSYSAPLLADGDVERIQFLLLVVSIVEPLLIDDGVYRNRRLTVCERKIVCLSVCVCVFVCVCVRRERQRLHPPSLSVSDDEFSLAPPNWNETVDGLDPALHGFPHRYPGDDTGSLLPHTGPLGSVQRSL